MQTCMWSVLDSALASVDLSPLLIRSIPGPGSVLGPQPAPQHCCQLITRLPWRALQGLCRVSEVPAPSRQWGQDCVSCGCLSMFHVPVRMYYSHAARRMRSCTTTTALDLGRGKEGHAEPQWGQLIPFRVGSTQGCQKQVCAPWSHPTPSLIWGHAHRCTSLVLWQLCHPEKGDGGEREGTFQ